MGAAGGGFVQHGQMERAMVRVSQVSGPQSLARTLRDTCCLFPLLLGSWPEAIVACYRKRALLPFGCLGARVTSLRRRRLVRLWHRVVSIFRSGRLAAALETQVGRALPVLSSPFPSPWFSLFFFSSFFFFSFLFSRLPKPGPILLGQPPGLLLAAYTPSPPCLAFVLACQPVLCIACIACFVLSLVFVACSIFSSCARVCCSFPVVFLFFSARAPLHSIFTRVSRLAKPQPGQRAPPWQRANRNMADGDLKLQRQNARRAASRICRNGVGGP